MSRDDWQRRLGPLYGGAVALVHSSSWKWPNDVRDDARSSGWVVAVGLPIGLVAYIAAAFIHWLHVPSPIAAIIGLAVLAIASAAIVEKGLVDRVDREQARSPSVPAILVLVFTILVRAAAIVSIAPGHWLGAFIATALVGRFAAVFLQSIGDPILDDRAPRSLVATPAPAWLVAALGLAVAALATIALGKAGLVAVILTAAAAFVLGVAAQRRDSGLSAPVVATAAALGELIVLLAATI
jgi:cobalamin synthase